MADYPDTLRWQLQLRAPIDQVYELLATDAGRQAFWVEESRQRGEIVDIRFSGGEKLRCNITDQDPPRFFRMSYFDRSELTFELEDMNPGTHLDLMETGFVDAEHYQENRAGWVSVLMALKACADYGIDLRNHDPGRNWVQGYPDN